MRKRDHGEGRERAAALGPLLSAEVRRAAKVVPERFCTSKAARRVEHAGCDSSDSNLKWKRRRRRGRKQGLAPQTACSGRTCRSEHS